MKAGTSTILSVAVTAMLGLSGAALAQDLPYPGADPALVEAAKAEGEVTLYCTQDEDISNATARAFEEAVPGISVRVLRLASVQLYSRLSAEFQSGVYAVDVFCSGDLRAFTDNADWWINLTPDIIPTITALPADAVRGNHMITSQGVTMMAYNTDMLSEEEVPKTWLDLLKPELKGRAFLVDPRNSTTYLTWVDYMYQLYGAEYLQKLAAQEFQLVSAGSPGVQEVAAGGAALVFPVTRSHVIPVIAKGAPIETVQPWLNSDVAATGSETAFGISARAPHPNAAKLYLGWLLTPAAQKINCGGAYASLVLPEDDRGECPPFAAKFHEQQYPSDEHRTMLLNLLGLN